MNWDEDEEDGYAVRTKDGMNGLRVSKNNSLGENELEGTGILN